MNRERWQRSREQKRKKAEVEKNDLAPPGPALILLFSGLLAPPYLSPTYLVEVVVGMRVHISHHTNTNIEQ